MSKNWKDGRAEAAMKEGTDKIMKAAQKLAKKEEPLFKKKIERNKESLNNTECVDWDSLNDANLDAPLTSWDEEVVEPKSFEICLGVGMNQFFPEYIKIELTEENENNL